MFAILYVERAYGTRRTVTVMYPVFLQVLNF